MSNDVNEKNSISLGLGPRRRRFKSCRSDHFLNLANIGESEGSESHQVEGGGDPRTTTPQNTPESGKDIEKSTVRLPKIIQNKKTKVSATIYCKSKGGVLKTDGSLTQPYEFYRVSGRATVQR